MKKLNTKQYNAGLAIIRIFQVAGFSMQECIEILIWLLKTNPEFEKCFSKKSS